MNSPLPVSILRWMSPVTVCAVNVVSFLWMLFPFTIFLLWMLSPFTIFTMDGIFSFYNILLWILSPFTIFYYYVISSFYNILLWMLFPLQYLHGCCLLGFFSFLYRFCLFYVSTIDQLRHIPYSCFNLSLLFFVQVYQLLNENYVEGGTYSA